MLKHSLLSASFLLVACGQAAPDLPSPQGGSLPPADTSAPAGGRGSAGIAVPRDTRSYGSFEVQWPHLSPEEAASRAHGAAQILLGRSLPLDAFVKSAKAALPAAEEWDGYPLNDGVLHVKYFARTNDLRLSNDALNREAEQDFRLAARFEEPRARSIAEAAVKELAAAGLVESERCAHFKTSRNVFLLGAAGEAQPAEIVTQYRFLASRRIADIDFMNAGFQIGVHYSGDLVAIRLGGATVNSREVPGFQSDFKTTDALARFAREFPRARAEWHGLRYFLPGDARGATVVDPLYVFSFSNVDGALVSRRRYVGYSVKNPSEAPHELFGLTHEVDTGDPRPSAEPEVR